MTHMSLPADIKTTVARALAEDLGAGDLTAQLIPEHAHAHATLRVRETAVLCGTAWFDETFRQLAPDVRIRWYYEDGAELPADAVICEIDGSARALLSGERTALNFLQTLSGTATAAREYVAAVRGTATQILDTRKTLPGLRLAQKYAVRCGGGINHRAGLFDAILIKENHIAAAGSISAAVSSARDQRQSVMVEVEVESLDQMDEALGCGADRLMLDNFSLRAMREAVQLRNDRAPAVELEASGGIDLPRVGAIAATGVDFISVGAITKHLRAVDFSLRFK